MHIGLIGGIGPAATEFYYRALIAAFAKAGARFDLTIAHADTVEMIANLEAGAVDAQAEIFARFVDRLKAAGADVAVVTSLGGHFCIGALERVSSLPLINAIPALDARFAALGLERVGLLGTRAVMESGLYGGVQAVEVVAPPAAELDRVHADYIAMARAGRATEAQKSAMLEAGAALCRDQGADAVVLAGTDLFLAFDGAAPGYPVLDAAQIHVDAITAAAAAPD